MQAYDKANPNGQGVEAICLLRRGYDTSDARGLEDG